MNYPHIASQATRRSALSAVLATGVVLTSGCGGGTDSSGPPGTASGVPQQRSAADEANCIDDAVLQIGEEGLGPDGTTFTVTDYSPSVPVPSGIASSGPQVMQLTVDITAKVIGDIEPTPVADTFRSIVLTNEPTPSETAADVEKHEALATDPAKVDPEQKQTVIVYYDIQATHNPQNPAPAYASIDIGADDCWVALS